MNAKNMLYVRRFSKFAVGFAIVLLATLAMAAGKPAFAASSDSGIAEAQGTLAIAAADADVTSGTADTVVAAKPSLTVRAKSKGKGWLAPVASGSIAGVATKPLLGFKISLVDTGSIGGHVKYRTYDAGRGWGAIFQDGEKSGRMSRVVQGVKIWLTGNVSRLYDVKYRTYVKGRGWLPWVRNKAAAGNTKGNARVTAIQVKLVAKPKSQLNGIDIASWQAGLNPMKVDADFIIVKSTEGTWYTNPYFRKWADATLASGKLLGSYHFASVGDAAKQADYFVETVGDYLGKCVLFLDWESSALEQGPEWAKKFMDRVYKKTGIKPLIYMSKSVCRNYDWSSVAPRYGLWVAQYSYAYQNKGTGYLSNPWTDDLGYGAWSAPTLYQYTSNGWIDGFDRGLDLDVFYGNASSWKRLAKES